MSTGKQALIEHIRAVLNHRAAHKGQREQEFDALNHLFTDVGELLDEQPHLIFRLQQRTRQLDGHAQPLALVKSA